MPHKKYYSMSDPVIAHLDAIVPSITDSFIVTRYTGFVSIIAVTVYELCIKDIFLRFSFAKHKSFGNFVDEYLYYLNGRIQLDDLKKDAKKFGDKYCNRFKLKLDEMEKEYVKSDRKSIKSSYHNIITGRHEFVHQGKFNKVNMTYLEAVESYNIGKKVIQCLEDSMKR